MTDIATHVGPMKLGLNPMECLCIPHMSSERSGMKFFQDDGDEFFVRQKPYLSMKEDKLAIHREVIMLFKELANVLQQSQISH